MPALVIPGAAQVRLIWLFGGGTIGINVLGASKPGATVIGQTLANSLGAAIKASFTSSGLAAHVAPGFSLATIGVRDLGTSNNPEFQDPGGSIVGAGTGDPLPTATALVVTLRTARAGQSYRGRVYLGGFTEADNDTNHSAVSGLQTAAVAFLTAVSGNMSSNGLTLAVLSRPSLATDLTKTVHNADGTTSTQTHHRVARPGAVTPVTAVVLRNAVWDSQRRRTAAGSASTFLRGLQHVDV